MRLVAVGALALLAGSANAQRCGLGAIDRGLIGAVRRPSLVSNAAVRHSADAIAFVGGYGPFVVAPAFYFFDNTRGDTRLRGERALGALVVSTVIGGGLKAVIGRARPLVSADSNPCDFSLFRGLDQDDYRAMPSGHATVIFALAAVAAEGRPRAAPYMYAGASLVGVARMYQDKHWASDVIVGAALGVAVGKAIARP